MVKEILDTLTKEYMNNCLEDYVNNEYQVDGFMDYMEPNNLTKIKARFMEVIDGEYESEYKLQYTLSKSKILYDIAEFIYDKTTQINPEGYATFRMKYHMKDFNDITDIVLDDTMMDVTIDGIVKILKMSYESVATPLYSEYHVSKEDDAYVIMNEEGQDVTDEVMNIDEAIEDIIPIFDDISEEDWLIASIVSFAPDRIFFKNFEQIEDDFFKKELSKLMGKNLILE